jgi:hypothetical protein
MQTGVELHYRTAFFSQTALSLFYDFPQCHYLTSLFRGVAVRKNIKSTVGTIPGKSPQ